MLIDNELEDFLNVQNIGATNGTWEIKFENLGVNRIDDWKGAARERGFFICRGTRDEW